MALAFIHTYIEQKLEDGMLNKDIAKELSLTPAMVGQYRLKRGYNPSLTVAKRVYTIDNIVLHPYSEESLQWEIENHGL